MAIQVPAFPPSNHILSGSHLLDTAPLPEIKDASISGKVPTASLEAIVSAWIDSFNSFINSDNVPAETLFASESSWRDLLCMSWDFRTLSGPNKIRDFTQASQNRKSTISIALERSIYHPTPSLDALGGLQVVQAFLTVETPVGRGRGLVKLFSDGEGDSQWKAITLFTVLNELKGHEEKILRQRPTGLDRTEEEGGQNWRDRLLAQQNFEHGREPTVLIIGAGQGGLTCAARLKQLGVETLLIDQNPHVGDNWRNRYHQLVLHDCVWYDHMPYLSFPPNWPVFTPKDKLADWFQYYAGVLELNVWTSTTLKKSAWSESDREWSVTLELETDGTKTSRELRAKHIILATGHSGEPYFPSNILGLDTFKGDRLIHSSQFTQPEKMGKGKRAIVVGSCNSGHDIARDYYDHGYDVTMIQRSSTLVLTGETLIDGTMKGLYDEDGPPTEDADILNMATPSPITKNLQIGVTAKMMDRDGPLLRGLVDAGFAVDSGPDQSGLWIKYLSRGGGYYIDVGCSQLIADRKIKVEQGREIKAIKPHSMVLADDTKLEADEIVFATGYQNMRETSRKIFGDELADRVGDAWGFDEEGETRTIWRRSGHPGFWFFGGNLALCRFYSRLLALQILGIEAGLTKA